MPSRLITDEQIIRLRGRIGKGGKALDKWKLCQMVFELWKKAKKDKEKAQDDKKGILMAFHPYAEAYLELQTAKNNLKKAEIQALGEASIASQVEKCDDLKFLRNEEFGILKGLFDRAALACEKDPLQVELSLFVENTNENAIKRFGSHSKYELYTEGVGRFIRGKNNKGPNEHAAEIEEMQKDAKNYVSPEIRKGMKEIGIDGYE